ncbi:MAG: DUF4271 domain-containing protein [Ferruginibacter sp.]
MKPISFLVFLLFILPASVCAQTADTLVTGKDSLKKTLIADTVKAIDSVKAMAVAKPGFKLKNKLLNADGVPVSLAVQLKKIRSSDAFFYLVAAMLLLLAFLRYFYSRYFSNLFRVFFNTSLRQNQITDQLLQAKLPSFLFNIFFVVSGGIYVYTLLAYYKLYDANNKWMAIFLSVALLGLVYLIKYCTLKFTGWITGLEVEVNIYVFVVFLINKIVGIFLVPFTVILAFSEIEIVRIAALVSLMCIGIFLLLRFFRSYGLIQNQLKISKFHFFLYIAGLEIMPLLLIYKGLMIYLTKNL